MTPQERESLSDRAASYDRLTLQIEKVERLIGASMEAKQRSALVAVRTAGTMPLNEIELPERYHEKIRSILCDWRDELEKKQSEI